MGLLFTYLLTYGGSAVAVFRPWYGLLIYVLFATIRPESLWFWSVPPGNYSRIIAIALLVGWAINGFGNRKFGRAFAIAGCLVGFWVWAAVSTTTAYDPQVALGFLESKGKIVLPFVVGLTLIRSLRQVRELMWVLVGGSGYVALELNRAYYDGFNRLQEIGFGGMDNNSFVIHVVALIGPAFFLGLYEKHWGLKAAAFASAALLTHCIFFSFSRGGMVALGFTGVVTFFLVPKRPGVIALFVAGAVTAGMMAGPEVLERLGTAFASEEERDHSAQSRIDMWGNCVTLTLENPITGVGPDNFPLVLPRFGKYGRGKEAHTLWLQIAAELGVPGVGFLLGFYLLTLWRLWPWLGGLPGPAGELHATLCRCVWSSIPGFMLAAQFVSLEGLESPYYIGLTGCGVIMLTKTAEEAGRSAADTGRRVATRRHGAGPDPLLSPLGSGATSAVVAGDGGAAPATSEQPRYGNFRDRPGAS